MNKKGDKFLCSFGRCLSMQCGWEFFVVILPYWKGRIEGEIIRGKFKIDVFLCMPFPWSRSKPFYYGHQTWYDSSTWTGRTTEVIESWRWPVRFNIGFDR